MKTLTRVWLDVLNVLQLLRGLLGAQCLMPFREHH